MAIRSHTEHDDVERRADLCRLVARELSRIFGRSGCVVKRQEMRFRCQALQ
ncbi:hypothetical protein D3C78_1972830 [compost metagenome]